MLSRSPRCGPLPWLALALLAAPGCDGGLEPIADGSACPTGFTGVCGTVTFRGAIPDSTQLVYVVAYATFPASITDLLLFQPLQPPELSLPTGPGDTTATYQMPLPAGTYEWILAVWKKVGTLTLTNADSLLREAGFYRDSTNPSLPGTLTVTGGVSPIDFVVDFGNMHPVSFYFPPVRR
jgi:hypothetical protein